MEGIETVEGGVGSLEYYLIWDKLYECAQTLSRVVYTNHGRWVQRLEGLGLHGDDPD